MTDKKVRLAIAGGPGMTGRSSFLHHAFLDKIGKQYGEIVMVTGNSTVGKTLGEVFYEKEWSVYDKKTGKGGLAYFYPFWKPEECPDSLKEMVVEKTDIKEMLNKGVEAVISCFDSKNGEIFEPKFLYAGIDVFSNSSAGRWYKPLVMIGANYKDIHQVEKQKTPGKQVNNTNCTAKGYTEAFYVLEKLGYTLKSAEVLTQQAISGKGDAIANQEYADMILGNVKDDWKKYNDLGDSDEEWKSSMEPQKVFGYIKTKKQAETMRKKWSLGDNSGQGLPIFSETSRVAVQNGHLEHITLEFNHRVNVEEIKEQLANYEMPKEVANLPTSPDKLFHILDRMPEPKSEDLYLGNGMSVVLGDFKQFTPHKISFWSLTHNLRTGATWATRHNMEYYLQEYKGYFKPKK